MSDLLYSFRSMMKNYINSSFILVFVTLLALFCANSPFAEAYFQCWKIPVSFQ
ncbi:MAG: Na+/H+ antiporter NhaA, partial [Bacteroidales bacterium]